MVKKDSYYVPMFTQFDKEYVAKQIREGFTSGQFMGEDGETIAWELNIEVI